MLVGLVSADINFYLPKDKSLGQHKRAQKDVRGAKGCNPVIGTIANNSQKTHYIYRHVTAFMYRLLGDVREAWHAAVHAVTKSWTGLIN